MFAYHITQGIDIQWERVALSRGIAVFWHSFVATISNRCNVRFSSGELNREPKVDDVVLDRVISSGIRLDLTFYVVVASVWPNRVRNLRNQGHGVHQHVEHMEVATAIQIMMKTPEICGSTHQ